MARLAALSLVVLALTLGGSPVAEPREPMLPAKREQPVTVPTPLSDPAAEPLPQA